MDTCIYGFLSVICLTSFFSYLAAKDFQQLTISTDLKVQLCINTQLPGPLHTYMYLLAIHVLRFYL